MNKIPDYLTRYYQNGENPFLSLNDMPYEQANKVKLEHCKKNYIGDFYAEDDYLLQRREIEIWIYDQLMEKGGHPTNDVPVYMTLGESPKGEFDIRGDIQKDAVELRISIKDIDLSAVTFTFPDSMYEIVLDEHGQFIDARRTNTPKVYLYHELTEVMEKYHDYLNMHYIEAQIWNREMLNSLLEK